ncbi:hypothetical protein COOONC_23019, partial [Cooperia oncophora]
LKSVRVCRSPQTESIQSLFPITITSVSTEVVIKGVPSDNLLSPDQTSTGFIESPRYPDAYPRALEKKYTLTNLKKNGYVRLVFDDFHVHFQSEMQPSVAANNTFYGIYMLEIPPVPSMEKKRWYQEPQEPYELGQNVQPDV